MRLLGDILSDNDWTNLTRFCVAIITTLSTAGFVLQRRTAKQLKENDSTPTIKDQLNRMEKEIGTVGERLTVLEDNFQKGTGIYNAR